jgi:hypothetical protein
VLNKVSLTVVVSVGVVAMQFLQEGGALPSGKGGNFEESLSCLLIFSLPLGRR